MREASFAIAGVGERRAAAALRPFQVGGEKKQISCVLWSFSETHLMLSLWRARCIFFSK